MPVLATGTVNTAFGAAQVAMKVVWLWPSAIGIGEYLENTAQIGMLPTVTKIQDVSLQMLED